MLLSEFQALPFQDAALNCGQKIQIIRGGNRSSKSLVAAVKVAAALTGETVKLSNGAGVAYTPAKRVYCAGKDFEHVSEKMAAPLFGSAIGIGEAPGLIAADKIEMVSWFNKTLGWPAMVRLKSGAEVVFGQGFSNHGFRFAIIWADEKVLSDGRLLSMVAQADVFIWSTWPDSTNDELRRLCKLAAETGAEFVFRMQDNTTISEEKRASILETWGALGSQHLQARNLGEFPADPPAEEKALDTEKPAP
jgi:hypothetical protein